MKLFLKIIKLALILFCFIGVEQLCKLKTRGFCIEKIKSSLPYCPDWETRSDNLSSQREVDQILDQPFYFLGSGHECYSFISEDKLTVIKLFKLNVRYAYAHKALRTKDSPENSSYNPIARYWKRVKAEQRERIHKTLSSAKYACDNLNNETGIIYLHLNDTHPFDKPLHIQDNLGIEYTVDLNKSKFLLQKKAELVIPKLTSLIKNNKLNEAKECIDSLLNLIISRSKKGFADIDPNLETNFGFVGNRAIVIDSGSFIRDDFHKNPCIYKKEILCETFKLKLWLEKESPELLNYFKDRVISIVQNE
jgi:hypothetical protein